MELKRVKVKDIIPYDKNPRKNDNAVDTVLKSIEQCGYCSPIVVDEELCVLAGHTRLKAIKLLKWEDIDVIIKRGLTDEQKRKYRVLDNKTSEIAKWDLELLKEEIDGLDFGNIDIDWGLEEVTFDDLGEEDDFDVELPEEPKAKLGDIYQLGNHRLMCGDSIKEEDVAKLMNGKKADMVFTDPPYGMKKEADGVLNDNLNFDDLLDFNKKWIPLTFEALKDNGSWYCWGIDEPLMDIYSHILKPMIKQKQIAFRNLITWDKGNGQGQMSGEFRMYPVADEKCLFVMKGWESCQSFSINQDDYNENMDIVRIYLETEIRKLNQSDKTIANALGYKDGRTVNHWWSKSQFALPTKENYEALKQYGRKILGNDFLKKEYDELKKEYDELKKEYYSARAYFNNTHDNMNNVWHFDRTTGDEREQAGGHATPKPIALCSRAIKSSSRENENVLDVFGGSGSTLIACEQLNRKCYMMELDPKYCDVILKRYINLKGSSEDVYRLNADGTKTKYSELN